MTRPLSTAPGREVQVVPPAGPPPSRWVLQDADWVAACRMLGVDHDRIRQAVDTIAACGFDNASDTPDELDGAVREDLVGPALAEAGIGLVTCLLRVRLRHGAPQLSCHMRVVRGGADAGAEPAVDLEVGAWLNGGQLGLRDLGRAGFGGGGPRRLHNDTRTALKPVAGGTPRTILGLRDQLLPRAAARAALLCAATAVHRLRAQWPQEGSDTDLGGLRLDGSTGDQRGVVDLGLVRAGVSSIRDLVTAIDLGDVARGAPRTLGALAEGGFSGTLAELLETARLLAETAP